MDLSMKWLNDYVKADMPIKEFCDGMTMSGSKVETWTKQGADITNVVVGKCVAMEKHPDADTLWVCQIDVGKDAPVQIVTSAQNVFVGAFVPAALSNATCYNHKDMSYMKIKKGKLRGVPSEGMMCSYEELNLDQSDVPYSSNEGILILNEDPDFDKMFVGEDIHDALGFNDTTVEFEITNNRPDCLSVLGLAKEASATFNLPLNVREPQFKGVDGSASDYISVDVQNTKLCSRYMAAVVKNVKIGPSPRWMAERLKASGVRSINNFVDITNFVMLEYGNPMHAFDLRYVEGGKINVRNAQQGEKITILDGSEVTLSPEMLIIADEKKPIAVAGVMGGEFSGIMDDTNTVVFEAACFDGVSVRMTAKKINKRTDASSRFEKGIDPINSKAALMRALELVEELGCGEVVRHRSEPRRAVQHRGDSLENREQRAERKSLIQRKLPAKPEVADEQPGNRVALRPAVDPAPMEQPRRCLGNAPETRHQHRQRVRRGKVDEHFKHRVLSLGIQRRDAQHHRRRNQHRYHLRGQQKCPLQSGLSAVPQLMQEFQQAFHVLPPYHK